MQGLLSFDAPILDIAPEQIQGNSQRFAVMLTDRVEVINILPQAPATQQAPQTAADCCNYLCSLASKTPGSSYEWFWTLDDVRLPTFEEQRRAQLLRQNVPSIIVGRWPGALLRFLASRRELWTQSLLLTPEAYAVNVSSILGVCKRRRCTSPPVLAVSEATAKKFVEELVPVIRFVQEGLSSDTTQVPVPCSAAARSQLYVNRSCEGAAEPAKQRVKRAMLQLVDVMERLRQLLSFVEILYKSGCVQSVLQHSLLQEPKSTSGVEASLPTAASMLLSTKLRDLVLSPLSMWPVVQLCNALILEVVRRQDTGEGRSSADTTCRELQEQCPAIFSEIDVRRCTKDASRPAVISVLQRYAAAKSPPEAVEGLRNLAAEDAAAAAQLCADKIAALPSDAVLDHARDLVAALLDAIRLEKLPELSKVLELFLQRTQSWRSGEDKSQQAQPVIHSMVVDHLLSTPRLHGLLDVMVSNSNAVAWAEILQLRANKSRMAAELLWRYHQQRGHVRPEWAQLQRLVETTQFYSLKDRIRYLRLSQERKSGADERNTLALRLSSAEKLQLPLFHELQEVASETSHEERRMAAKKCCHDLNQLQSIRELFEVAGDFGLGHLQLAIAGFSGAKMAHDVVATLWVSLLFPRTESLYSEKQAPSSPRELFPLLMLRPHQEFFLSKQEVAPAKPIARPEPKLLRWRMLTFLRELREVAPDNHTLWEARCVGTLLEFSNCLWLQNCSPEAPQSPGFGREGDASAGSPLINETCLWVATEVLSQEPFNMSLADLVTFYAEMISNLHVWHKQLQEIVPAYLRAKPWLWPSEEDVHLHLSQVATVVLAGWLREAERLCNSSGFEKEKAEHHFAQVGRRSADGLLAGLYLRLNGSKHATAQRLLVEVLRLEKSCRLLLEQVVYLGPET